MHVLYTSDTMNNPLNLLPVLLLSGISSSAFANFDHGEQDFFDMSIEKLLEVETSVAGFSSESILSAPSVVTVFTQSDLRAFGVSNVYDLMNYVPGFQSDMGEFISGHKKLQSRGVYLDSGYVLIMIDGIRINEMSFGKASVYTPNIDLALAERVEIIRGPGSAVYGSNAFLGVINIVSKSSNDLKFEVGKDSHKRFTASLAKPVGVGEVMVNLSLAKGDGSEYKLKQTNNLGSRFTSRPYVHRELGVKWQTQAFDVKYRIDSHELDGFVNLEGYHPENYFKSQNQYLSTGVSHSFNTATSIKASMEWADHKVESAGFILSGDLEPQSHDFINGPYWATDRLTLNSSVSHKWHEALLSDLGIQWQKEAQYKAGVVTSHLTPDNESTIPLDIFYLEDVRRLSELGDFVPLKQSIESAAVYGQVKWAIAPNDTLHIGARYEDYKSSGSAFSPRVTFIHGFDEHSQVKAIYSEAFRAPVTNELYSNDGVTKGNPLLEPELVKTTELQYFYQASNWSMELTAFNTSLSKLIVSETLIDEGGRTEFVNKGKESVSGMEGLVNYNFSQSFKLRATATHFLTDTVEASYESFASVSLFYQYGNWHTSFNTLWRPSVSIDEGIRLDRQQKVFEQESLVLINGNIRYQAGRHLSLQLAIDNLTDERYSAYEPRQDQNQYSIPQAGRQLRLAVDYQF